MKKELIFMFLMTVVFSCSNSDDEVDVNTDIIGEWRLTEALLFGFTETSSIDYSSENIIYKFTEEGILIVSGGENVGYPNGEYNYVFELDYLGSSENPDGPMVPIVKIETMKWTHNFTNERMTLGTSYVDGPDLVFVRN